MVNEMVKFSQLLARFARGFFKSESRVPPPTLAPRFSRAADGNTGNSINRNFWCMARAA
jgi:hypothetical protein